MPRPKEIPPTEKAQRVEQLRKDLGLFLSDELLELIVKMQYDNELMIERIAELENKIEK